MYKKFLAEKKHLGKCKWMVVVVVVRGGRRGSSKFTNDHGAGRAKLVFVDMGAPRNITVRKSHFRQDGYYTALNSI